MIVVVGSVVARADAFDRLLQASLAHVHRSRAEPGCISHAVHIDAENRLRLFFYEEWTDHAALDAHFAQAGSAQFMAIVRGACAEPPTIRILKAQAKA